MSTLEQPGDRRQPAPNQGLLEALSLRYPILSLCLVCAILFLPGLTTLPPLDRDESRFAQATSQMLETGDYIDIRFQEGARYQKPVGIYWLQSLSVTLLSSAESREIWAYRVPSALAAWLSVLLTFWGVRRLFDERTALIASSLLAASVVVLAEANIAKTDAALLAAITAAQICLGLIYCGARREPSTAHFAVPGPLSLGFWVAIGVGLLVKGPVILMVCGLTIVALCLYDRELSWLRRLSALPGLVIVLAIILPWTSAIWQLTDGEFFIRSVGGDMLSKVGGGQESHGAPPGYFSTLSFVTFWPGCLFLIPALYWGWTQRHKAGIRFMLAWAIPAWIAFELVPTKLPHYTMPLYPALAALCGAWVAGIIDKTSSSDQSRWLENINLALFGLVTLVLALIIAPLPYLSDNMPVSIALALLFFGVVLMALRARWKGGLSFQVIGFLILAAIVWNGAVKLVTIPSASDFYVSPNLSQAVARASATDGPPVVVSGYREPSLVFLLGTETKLAEPKDAAQHMANVAGTLAIIESSNEKAFLDHTKTLGLAVESLETVTGLNYSRGDQVELRLYRRVEE